MTNPSHKDIASQAWDAIREVNGFKYKHSYFQDNLRQIYF